MANYHRRYRGFTLVELLVVLTITAILMAMLMTGLRVARLSAQRAECRTRMKGAWVLLDKYANAHNGKYPTSGTSGDEDTDWQNATERNDHLGLMEKLGVNAGKGEAETFFCPNTESMQAYAQNDADYGIAGETDSITYTDANLAAGNLGYLYWNFGTSSGWYGKAAVPEAFAPRWLRSGLGATDGRTGELISDATSRIWVLSDWFREVDGDTSLGVYPHGRDYGKGLNVLFLDGHAAEHFGTPYGSMRNNLSLPFYE